MRKIKFRGYAVEEMVNSQWQYGTSIHIAEFTDEHAERTGKKEECFIWTESGWIEVEKESIGQFTEIFDISDNEVYEGQSVKLTVPDQHYVTKGDGYEDVDVIEGFVAKGVVKFLHSMWFVDRGDGKGCPLDFDTSQALEIMEDEA